MYSTPFQIVLTQEEATTLKKITSKPTAPYRDVLRSQIVLLAHDGLTNIRIAKQLAVSVPTVSKWRKRYATLRLEGLKDAPRSGRKCVFSPEVRFEAAHLACTAPEKHLPGVTKWSYAKLAKVLVLTTVVKAISQTRVQTWLKSMKVKPYRVKYYLKPMHPQFQTLMRAILKLYFHPPEDGPLLCVDEKTGIQVKEPLYPDKEEGMGLVARESQYKRHGVVCLFGALEVRTGCVMALVRSKHKTSDFTELLWHLHTQYASSMTLHLILDNLSTHKSQELLAWLSTHGLEKRFQFHFLPPHGSWLNQIEIWFGIFSRESLKQAACSSKEEMERLILAYTHTYNERFAHPFDWKYGKDLL